MKKNLWMIAILCLVAWLLTGCSQPAIKLSSNHPPTPAALSTEEVEQNTNTQVRQTDIPGITELDQSEQTEHFAIYFPLGEQASASYIGIILEENLERVCTDLGQCPHQKIDVSIYPDLKVFHLAIGYPDAPDWVVGFGGNGKIQMLTPRLISGELAEKAVVHELVHVLQKRINPDIPIWMGEGIAMYEAGMSEGVRESVTRGIQENSKPTLAAMETMDPEAFAEADGYAYAYTIVEYAVNAYSKDIISTWVKTPRDYERVFGVSREVFEKQWMDQLSKIYRP